MAKRDYLLFTIGASAILMTASAHVRIEAPRQDIATSVGGGSVSVEIDKPDEETSLSVRLGLSGLGLLDRLVAG